MLEHLFQQTILFEKKIGKNEYGKNIYAPPIPIAVRYEGSYRVTQQQEGDKINRLYSIFTNYEVFIEDRLEIDGEKMLVLEVTTTPDPNNPSDILFREIYTKAHKGVNL